MRHQLPPAEVKSLLQLIQAHRTPQAMVRRARIVLAAHAHPDWSSQQLAQLLELKARLVRKWRRRWDETHSRKRFTQIRSTSSFSRPGPCTRDGTSEAAYLALMKSHWLIGVE